MRISRVVFIKCVFLSVSLSEDNGDLRRVRCLYFWQALISLFCSARLQVDVCDESLKKKKWLEDYYNFLISILQKIKTSE